MRLLPWRRPAAAAESPPDQPGFDAIISLGPYNLPPGVSPARGIAATRQAVQALPGAGWISVEHHPYGSPKDAVEVFPAGAGACDDTAIRRQVEVTTARALNALTPRSDPAVAEPAPAQPSPTWPTYPTPTTEHPVTGFAEGPIGGLALPWGATDQLTTDQPTDGQLPGFTDAELLSRLLACVAVRHGADAAAAAVAQLGSFAAVLSASERDLRSLPGLGTQGIAAIKLVHAAALRLARAAVIKQPVLDQPAKLISYLTAVLARESIEHFRILFLDEQGRLRADEAQARGTVNHTPVYPREVVRRALELEATSIILVHNHPSGDPTPSGSDLEMTAMIQTAAETLGLAVSDHIIVGNGKWLSFSKAGLL